ncbi:hypothetical protein DMX08_19830 [Pseudomonas protegens]|uniref:Uncharacterized protein n=1 Tax=Pseudomonas protegens TaxID=380021 RepID=A0A9Q6IEG8_9PSED|nr:hypothetical protein DMX08_19830 [Pseudomonas protegens]
MGAAGHQQQFLRLLSGLEQLLAQARRYVVVLQAMDHPQRHADFADGVDGVSLRLPPFELPGEYP